MSLKMFKFSVENTRTGESTAFLGQGDSVEVAFKDGVKNVVDPFRPSSSGARRPEHSLAVTTKSGAIVKRTLAEFQSDQPHADPGR